MTKIDNAATASQFPDSTYTTLPYGHFYVDLYSDPLKEYLQSNYSSH